MSGITVTIMDEVGDDPSTDRNLAALIEEDVGGTKNGSPTSQRLLEQLHFG